jgi:hypothetical protein
MKIDPFIIRLSQSATVQQLMRQQKETTWISPILARRKPDDA